MEPYPCGDPRLPHHLFPPKKITPDELSKRTGTLYWKLDTLDQVALAKRLTTLKLEHSFKKEDIFTLDAETTANFDDKIEELFEESSVPFEQARMIIEGTAYYDVEDKNGQWVRIFCEYGDLILIPANTCFRFTTTPHVSATVFEVVLKNDREKAINVGAETPASSVYLDRPRDVSCAFCLVRRGTKKCPAADRQADVRQVPDPENAPAYYRS